MKTHHKSILVLLLASSFSARDAAAQTTRFFAAYTQQYTSINFTNSKGEFNKDDYHGTYSGAFHLGIRHHYKSLISGIAVGMRSAGADLVYDGMNYSWRMQYLDFRGTLGMGFKAGRTYEYFNVTGYYGYMVHGIQTLNNENYNIVQSGIFKRGDMGIVVVPGIQFSVNNRTRIFGELSYLMGLKNIEKDSGQKSLNRAYGFTLGVAVNINGEKK